MPARKSTPKARTRRSEMKNPAKSSVPLQQDEGQDGRARLLTAALRLFGERGYAATSITDLAAAAGVTRGLIRFHFGSKQGLADAVDQLVIDRLAEMVDAFTSQVTPATITEFFTLRLGQVEREQGLQNYVRRSFLEPTPRNIELFKKMFRVQKRLVQGIAALGARQMPIGDDWLALVSFFLNNGLLVFRPQVEAILGHDPLTRGGIHGAAEVFSVVFRHVFNVDSIQTGSGTPAARLHD